VTIYALIADGSGLLLENPRLIRPFKYWFMIALLVLPASQIAAYPRLPAGSENIPQLMAESALVCKGEVFDAPAPVYSWEGKAGMKATALVRADRCFKGAPQGPSIPVLFDGFPGMGPAFVLRKGEYRLFFLKSQDGKYPVVDIWFGALPISRKLGATPEGADRMQLLELDLIEIEQEVGTGTTERMNPADHLRIYPTSLLMKFRLLSYGLFMLL
jgi:hypothetical protein